VNVALSIYRAVWGAGLALRIPSLVLRGRPDELRERLGFVPQPPPGGGPLWIHAASVGETAAAEAVLRELGRCAPRAVALSTMTRTGRARAARLAPDFGPFPFPLDAPRCVRTFLERLRPSALILLETEIWPNLLLELSARSIPWAVASGRLTARSMRRTRFVRGVYRRVLEGVAAVGARTEEDAERFRTLGAPSDAVRVTGDLKEDVDVAPRVAPPRDGPRWIAACTRPGEEEIAIGATRRVARTLPRGELILAPRHPDRFREVAETAARSGWPLRRWEQRDDPRSDNGWSILVVDEMGVLEEAYRRSHCTLVGGSLRPFGGHSPLEAAAAGRPILLGPHTENCSALATRLEESGGALRVRNEEDLADAVERILRDTEEAERRGRAAHAVVAAGGGAAKRTLDWLSERGVLR
jgi:3-deoxy-D-manno-octulosonic-acid transferase